MPAVLEQTRWGGRVELIRSKEAVVGFIREMLDEIQKNYVVDRRHDPRYSVCVPIDVIPYDAYGQRTNEPFIAVTRDISAGGISFLHRESIHDRFLLVRFPQSRPYTTKRIALEMLRCRPVGPFWKISCRFIVESSMIEREFHDGD